MQPADIGGGTQVPSTHSSLRHAARCCSPQLLGDVVGGGEAGAPLPATSATRASSPCAWGGLGWGLRSRNVTPRTGRPGRTRCGRSAPTTRTCLPPIRPRARERLKQAAQHLRSQGFGAPPWASLLERDEAAAASRSQWEGGHSRPGWPHAVETLFADLDSGAAAVARWRVLLLRRLRLPLPLAPKHCACGALLDELGDHRSACAQVGALARRAGLLERAAARICKGAGARVATNVALRELNLDVPAADGRRAEVVANGLPLWQGARSTRRLSAQSDVTAAPALKLTASPASPSPGLSTGNTARTLSSSEPDAASSLCSVLNLGDASTAAR